MAVDHSSDRWGDQNDPFGDEFYSVPYEEVVRARAEHVLGDNRDALRHFVELAIWEALDRPERYRQMLWIRPHDHAAAFSSLPSTSSPFSNLAPALTNATK
jgi:hypothetical protein